MMKILHIIPSIAPVRGGPSQAIVQMVRELRSQGIDAEIATTNDNGDRLLDVPLYDLTEYQQIPVRFFPRFSPKISVIREFAFSSTFTTWLWQNIRSYDLLHIHAIFAYPATIAMTIARQQNIPYIVRPIGQLCPWSLSQKSTKKQLYLKLIETANLNHSRSIHFTAELEKTEAEILGLVAPKFVLPLGLSLPPIIPDARARLRQQLHIPSDEPIILFLSRIHPKKGLDYLIPALGKILDRQFTFILAGNGEPEYQMEVDRLLAKSGILDRTHRPGFVAADAKNLLLQGADLFVLTSHSENFGIVVLEALAAGLPVAITEGVGLADIVRQEQLGYVVDLDVRSIAESIAIHLTKLSNSTITERSSPSREFIKNNYSWAKITMDLVEIYQRILAVKFISIHE